MTDLTSEEYIHLTGFTGEWRDSWWNLDFLQLISQRHGLEQARNVLDLGCGAGHFGRTLARVLSPEIRLTGIDPEPEFLVLARERAPQFEYKEGRAEEIPERDEQFDLVLSQTVLMHVRDLSQTLAEILRVLRSGGCLLAAEPNNVASAYTLLGGCPTLPWPLQESWLRFQHFCEQGKRALGEGDSSVGERLGGLLVEAGFENIRVAVNERTPALVPPYAKPEMRVEKEQLLEWLSEDNYLRFGTRQNSRRYFLASGQDETAFERHWEDAMEVQRRIREALLGNTFHGGRCPNFYLVCARKP